MNIPLAARLISEYLVLGMHHSTPEGRTAMEEIMGHCNYLSILFYTGCKVYKKSGKPFKSGAKINTMKDFTINPNTGLIALRFNEDDSIVDCKQCALKYPT